MFASLSKVTTIWESVKTTVIRGETSTSESEAETSTQKEDAPVEEVVVELKETVKETESGENPVKIRNQGKNPIKKPTDEEADSDGTEGPDDSPSADRAGDLMENELNEESNPDAATKQELLHNASNKAMDSAKAFGGYLFSFGKAAADQAATTASRMKKTVEDKTILGDFQREQDKFVKEQEDRKKYEATAIPPWVGYAEEETLKNEILTLSENQGNFLRSPPTGVQFEYDAETSSPIGLIMLQEDPKLEKMRFELVPKQVTEEAFWKNYFYRVSLIKQSSQLTILVQQANDDNSLLSSKPPKSDPLEINTELNENEFSSASPTDHEFASDAFKMQAFNEEELRAEMQQIGVSGDDDLPAWEQELQAELQEFEVVSDGIIDEDDLDLENEILKEIENSSS